MKHNTVTISKDIEKGSAISHTIDEGCQNSKNHSFHRQSLEERKSSSDQPK